MFFKTKSIDLSKPHVMGILNITPDSFSDGGDLFTANSVDQSKVLSAAEVMIQSGATFLDVGGESTRPGFTSVSIQEELDRVMPAIEAIRCEFDVVISIDTSKPEVMLSAASGGADMINDVMALTAPGAMSVCAAMDLPIVLMHGPTLPPLKNRDTDLLKDVECFLTERIALCMENGIQQERLLIDPGFGFGKSVNDNISLLNNLSKLSCQNFPMVVGLSRKNTISKLLGGRSPKERMAGSIALAVMAYAQGARIFRVHDVKETFDAINIAHAFNHQEVS